MTDEIGKGKSQGKIVKKLSIVKITVFTPLENPPLALYPAKRGTVQGLQRG